MNKELLLSRQETSIKYAKLRLNDWQYSEYKDIKILKGVRVIESTIRKVQPRYLLLYIWKGKKMDPIINYRYHDVESLNATIDKAKRSADRREEWKLERKRARIQIPTFEVGDIFVGSWGYEQTNVDAYQVIEKPSKHYGIFQEISLDHSKYDYDRGEVKPIKDSFTNSKPIRRKVTNNGVKFNDVVSGSKWDGKRSFYKSSYY